MKTTKVLSLASLMLPLAACILSAPWWALPLAIPVGCYLTYQLLDTMALVSK